MDNPINGDHTLENLQIGVSQGYVIKEEEVGGGLSSLLDFKDWSYYTAYFFACAWQ